MASAITSMAKILNTKSMTTTTTPKTPNHPKPTITPPPTTKPLSLLSLPKILSLTYSKPPHNATLASAAIAGAIFSALSSCDTALAAQQIAEIAAEGSSGDNRALALLLPIIPAIAWVLFNILQPALNQINRMRNKGVLVGLGLGGGLAGSGFVLPPPHAAAGEVATIGDAAGDNRGQLLLFVIAPAIVWVVYNILQPALNQLNRMRSE